MLEKMEIIALFNTFQEIYFLLPVSNSSHFQEIETLYILALLYKSIIFDSNRSKNSEKSIIHVTCTTYENVAQSLLPERNKHPCSSGKHYKKQFHLTTHHDNTVDT